MEKECLSFSYYGQMEILALPLYWCTRRSPSLGVALSPLLSHTEVPGRSEKVGSLVKGTRCPSFKPLNSSKAQIRTYKQVKQLRPFREWESLLYLWKHQKSIFPGGMYSWETGVSGWTWLLWKVKHAIAHYRRLVILIRIYQHLKGHPFRRSGRLSLGKTVHIPASITLDLSEEYKTWPAQIKFGSAANVVTYRRHWKILNTFVL